MKFEAIRPYDHRVMMSTEYTSCIYDGETLASLAAAGYTFKINGKLMSTRQVLAYVEEHPNERPTGKVSEPEPEEVTIVEPVKAKAPEVQPANPKVVAPPAPTKPVTSDEPFIVTYTRWIENGKFDKTYDQIKAMKTFDLAKVFIDKKVKQQSRFWAGATITDGRSNRIIYSVDCDYKVDDYREVI